MTEDVVYFSDEVEEDLAEFCDIRNIDYLPLKEGFKFMEFDGEDFSEEDLSSVMILAPDDKIFNQEVIESFLESSGVKFVTSGGQIVGVIHFSDYNSKELYTELYSVLHEIEQKLRMLLEHKELEEEIDLEEELGISRFNPEDMALPLSTSFFSSIVQEIDESEKIGVEFKKEEFTDNGYQIVELRNRIMHSKENVLMQDSSKDNLSFSEESFSHFIDRIREACRLEEELSERVDELSEHPVLDNLRRN
jgi:hypothetical protein